MRSRLALFICAIAAFAPDPMALAAPNPAAPSRPNIVFIIADDLRYDLLGCNGHPHSKTPNIDRLAKEGANFSNFFSVTPLCSPSRASFLTGLYPHEHRVINNDAQNLEIIGHRLMTFPRILREEAGYTTALIGKFHIGYDDSRRPGFDHWISFKGQGQFIDPVVNIDGRQQQTNGYLTDLITQWGVDFLERDFDRPFCLYLAHEAVHNPFIPAKRHDALYMDVPAHAVNADPQALKGKKALTREMPKLNDPHWIALDDVSPEPGEPRRGRPMNLPELVRDQLRCLSAVDEGVGRILDTLKRKGVLDNTIVIFTSDHGFLHGEFGVYRDKRWGYDPCLRIPFLMRYPPLAKAGSRVDALAASIDVAPTMLDVANVKWYTPLPGRSLVSLFSGPSAGWRDSLLFEYFQEKVVPKCPRYFGVRTKDWKYIHYPHHEGMDELYHLAADPSERVNVADDAKSSSNLARMREELILLNRATHNPFSMSFTGAGK